MLYLALGDLENALEWATWTYQMNSSIFNAEQANYYRALINSLELFLDENRDPAQYREVFNRMYGEKAVDFAWNAINGGNPFFYYRLAMKHYLILVNIKNYCRHMKITKAKKHFIN